MTKSLKFQKNDQKVGLKKLDNIQCVKCGILNTKVDRENYTFKCCVCDTNNLTKKRYI